MKFDNTNEPDGVYAHAVKHIYHTATGALIKVQECIANATNDGCDLSLGQVYWQAKRVDAAGNLTLVQLGNGLSTFRDIDRTSGTLRGIQTGASNADGTLADMSVQHLAFTWDIAGNLTHRQDQQSTRSKSHEKKRAAQAALFLYCLTIRVISSQHLHSR